MAQQTDATIDELEQIDKELIANNIGRLGETYNPHNDDAPEMRYYNIAAYNRHEDVHRALLIDSNNPDELYYAWTNEQRTTWKIEGAGTRVIVSNAEVEAPEDVDDATDFAQGWIDILVDELRYDAENQELSRSVSDEIQFAGSKTLKLRDVDERRATFDITLE